MDENPSASVGARAARDDTHGARAAGRMAAVQAAEQSPEAVRCNWDAVDLCGVTINSLTLADVLQAVDVRIAGREPGYICTPNVDHVVLYQTHTQFRDSYGSAFLILPDGVPIIWASHLLGKPLRRKISGSDLIYSLSEHAAREGHSVFFLGATEGVAEEAARVLTERYPGLKVAGCYSPPSDFENDPEENAKVIGLLREAAPDICYVALGTPKQCIWNWKNHKSSGVPVLIGVGGSFDFVTGKQKRAPRAMQRMGLEWLWRLCRDPRRLWRRYLVRDMRFVPLVWRELRKNKSG